MTDKTSWAELRKRFDSLRVFQRAGVRAVHKPLLVLYMLGRLWRGEGGAVRFADIEGDLVALLTRFGPASARATPHNPFWHLRSDGVWDLEGPGEILARPPAATPSKTEARVLSGQFSPEVQSSLLADRERIAELARFIVSAHFPDSLTQDVLSATGLEDVEAGAWQGASRAGRSAQFRKKILLAYEFRCCVCSHDLRLDGQVVGLEAAHIKWFQAGGPDVEPNGLALCSLHHKLFDLGVFTITPGDYVLMVSQHVTGSDKVKQLMLTYHGAGIILPQSKIYFPEREYLDWHEGSVFKRPARD